MKTKSKTHVSIEDVRKIVERDGEKGWNMAKEILLQQETDIFQLKQALNYLTLIPDYFRPAIVSYCCQAVGGNPNLTVPTGASLILFAKAIGIHDDIIDDVKKRKKHVTVFGKFGKEIALVISDILLFKGFTLLRKNLEIGLSPDTLSKILETIDRVWFEQGESEVLEQQFRTKVDVLPEHCLAKIRKRASEFEAITRIGAILGEASQRDIEALASYGRLLGTASILRDELVDILETEALRNRIKRESLPLPLVYALQKTSAKSSLIPIISRGRLTKPDLIEIAKTVDRFDGIDYVAKLIDNAIKNACSCIQKMDRVNKLIIIAKALRINKYEWKSYLEAMSTN